MTLNTRTLVLALALTVGTLLSPLASAAGGGSGPATPTKAVDPDYAKAEKAIEAKDCVEHRH
jgi:hypothetical protein